MKERAPSLDQPHKSTRRIYGFLAASMLFVSSIPVVAVDRDQMRATHYTAGPVENALDSHSAQYGVIVGQDEADMIVSAQTKLHDTSSWDGLAEHVCVPQFDMVSICDEASQLSSVVSAEKPETIVQTEVKAPSHDPSLTPDEKWKVALDLARAACPSNALFAGDFEVRAQYGEDRDGRLGYTDVTTRKIVIDVRPAQRAIDIAITYLHEANHGQDVDERFDRTVWMRAMGLAEETEWYLAGSLIMSPAESLAVVTSAALVGRSAFEDSLQNSGYTPNPAVVKLMADTTPHQLQTARELSGCV